MERRHDPNGGLKTPELIGTFCCARAAFGPSSATIFDENLVLEIQQMRNGPTYDAFLSHNSADKPSVIQIGLKLQSAGLKPYLDIWNLQRGASFQPSLSKA